jgi:hypothetical protein
MRNENGDSTRLEVGAHREHERINSSQPVVSRCYLPLPGGRRSCSIPHKVSLAGESDKPGMRQCCERRDRGDTVCGRQVPAVCEGQSDRSGQLCAIRARPEQPYFGHGPQARDGRHPAVGMTFRELAPKERQELD